MSRPSWIIQKTYAKGHGGHKKAHRPKPAALRGCGPMEKQAALLAMKNSGELAQMNAARDAANRERQQSRPQPTSWSSTYRW